MWLVLIAVAIVAALVPLPADHIERWYSQGFYPVLQAAVTPATNLIPFAIFDLAIVFVLAAAAVGLRNGVRVHGWRRALRSAMPALATFAAVTYLLFLVLWGFNYRRVPLEHTLDYDGSRVSRAAARELAATAVQRLNAAYPLAHDRVLDAAAVDEAFTAAQRLLGQDRHAVPGLPKRSLLEVYFRAASIDGMIVPFFLEIIINPDVLPFEQPMVMAHEWAHLAGYANEADANFVAWLTCVRGDALAQYSAWLSAYSHALGGLPRSERHSVAAELQEGPRRDLAAIAARYARATPAVRHVARETYDVYLRANRVEDGIASYNAVLRLILGTNFEHDWQPVLRERRDR